MSTAAWILLSVLILASPSLAVAQDLQKFAEGRQIMMIRHAEAPGNGDPDGFQIDDCSTQRNLSAAGRAQAERLGFYIRSQGVEDAVVLSSQWCRCLETAKLINMGKVQELKGLNSFFQGIVPREATLASLRKFLHDLPPDGDPVLLVTHQVTISAITGMGVSSGAAVAYDPVSDQAQRVTLPTD